MKTLVMNLTALEPLVITSGSAESMAHECLGYIPGNMQLGALAGRWVKTHPGKNPDADPDFRRLFLNGEVSWGHAFPLCEGKMSAPIPLSYRRAKNHASLPEEGTFADGREYFVFNLLALPDSENAIQETWRRRFPAPEVETSEKERIKIKKMGARFMNPDTLRTPAEKRVFNIHVALGRQRSALEGQLFGYSAIAAGTRFRSLVSCKSAEAEKALANLVRDVPHFYVGHSRSAGYGRVKADFSWIENEATKTSKKRDFQLFLHSQYLPFPSWEDPLENLAAMLEQIAGERPALEKKFAGFEQIQGYNNLWNRPRDSRLALAMGSTFAIRFEREVSLPKTFSLGADQREGYGRIEVDPPFLESKTPEIAKGEAPAAARTSPAPGNGPIWNLLRERAAARQAEAQAETWMHSDAWSKFLESAARLSRPTASQRNNLRDMSRDKFWAMLEKTPGEQWETAVCYCPFENRQESLADIMLKTLDSEKFLNKFEPEALNLPGAPASAEDRREFGKLAHRRFLRELISTWGKLRRIGGEE